MTLSIVRNYEDRDYNELGQRRKCMFAFAEIVGNKVHVLHKPVLCRDFLNDTLVAVSGHEFEDEEFYIYGYNFAGPLHEPVMIVDDSLFLEKNIHVLWQVENELGFTPTKIAVVKKTAVLEFDPKWFTNTVMFSWYTTVLRGLSYEQPMNSLSDIPVEGWMEDKHEVFVNLWKHFLDMPNLGVAGCSDECLKCDWETVHENNGWFSNVSGGKFTRYGKFFNERLRKA